MENREIYHTNPSINISEDMNSIIGLMLPFENENHRQSFELLKNYFKKGQLKNKECLSALFILSAINKPFIEKYITDDGIHFTRLLRDSRVAWLTSEIVLVKLASVLFNSIRNKVTIDDIFSKLSPPQITIALEAIRIRYS